MAEQGKLLPHPVLILESWDRYSRDTLDETFESVRKLLKAGIAFHIGYGDRTFTKSSLQSAEQRGEIERALEAAHNYSKSLSDRVSQAKQRKIAKVINGDMANLNDMAPTWATYDKATKTYIRNEKASVVVDIFKWYLAGESIYGIVRKLNTSGEMGFNGKMWCASSLKYILSSKSVMGDFKGRAGVFPKLIDKADFDKVQAILERNKGTYRTRTENGKVIKGFAGGRRGHRAEMVNIFLGLVYCGCGRRATLSPNHGGRQYYYRCPYAYQGTGCTQRRMFPSHLLEEDFFAIVIQQTPRALLGNADTKSKERLAVLEANREATTRKINTVLAIDEKLSREEIKARYNALVTERDSINKEITDLKHSISLIGNAPKALGEIERLLASGDDMALDEALRTMQATLKDKEIRQRLQVLMPSIVKSIVLDFRNLNFTATFTSGKSIKHSVAH